jgi:hypothetical protein
MIALLTAEGTAGSGLGCSMSSWWATRFIRHKLTIVRYRAGEICLKVTEGGDLLCKC